MTIVTPIVLPLEWSPSTSDEVALLIFLETWCSVSIQIMRSIVPLSQIDCCMLIVDETCGCNQIQSLSLDGTAGIL